jgi:PTS system fructose-specific IIA component/PTS system nitrogen regulatory IIA component
MRATDIICVYCPSLEAADKIGCIRRCAELIGAKNGLSRDTIKDLVRAILKRELLGSTGIGGGVAFPHTKHSDVASMHAGVFVLRPPISFESLDGKPVQVLLCFISPQDRPGDHLRFSEALSRTFRDDTFVRRLIQCRSSEEMKEEFKEVLIEPLRPFRCW